MPDAIKNIGVGIVGAGFGLKVHFPAWSALPGVKVLGIAGRNSEGASRISKDLRLPIIEGPPEESISSPEVGLLVVSVQPASQP
jgi:predicted dehydrogenase